MHWKTPDQPETRRCEVTELRPATTGLLAILASHRSCTPTELRRAMEQRFVWSVSNQSFYQTIHVLVQHGLVNKQGAGATLKYLITQEGLWEWRQIRAFYESVVELGPRVVDPQFAPLEAAPPEVGSLEAAPVVAAPLVTAPVGQRPEPVRCPRRGPTPEELEAVIGEAIPRLACLLRGYQLSQVVPFELATAAIPDFDVQHNLLKLPAHGLYGSSIKQQRIELSPAMAQHLHSMCAGRTRGPIYRAADGGYWKPATLANSFRAARRRLGLSEEIVLHPPHKKRVTRDRAKVEAVEAYLRAVGSAKPHIIAADLQLPLEDVQRVLGYERFEADHRGRFALSHLVGT